MTFYELFNTKTIKFCPKLLDGKSQISTTLLKINRTCNCFGRDTQDSIILVNQQTIILMTGCPVHIISMKKSYPFSTVVNCLSASHRLGGHNVIMQWKLVHIKWKRSPQRGSRSLISTCNKDRAQIQCNDSHFKEVNTLIFSPTDTWRWRSSQYVEHYATIRSWHGKLRWGLFINIFR